MKNTSVGVVNPSARTETFGMGAIEMNCAGLPVVTLGKNGYPDTIENGVTGYLCHSYKEIAEIMGTSLSSVESLLFRAKNNLEKIFNTK